MRFSVSGRPSTMNQFYWKGKAHPHIRRDHPIEGIKMKHFPVTSENLTNNQPYA